MDADAFSPFFHREFQRLVVHLIARGYSEFAEDVAEETMKEAYETWATITSPAAWVRTVAVRKARKVAARERQRADVEGEYEVQLSRREVLSPELAAALTEEQRAVVAQLAGMPEARRCVLAMAFDGYKVKEIASKLCIKEATVRSHLRHLRDAFGTPDDRTGGMM